jgi:hypothetical protein
MPKNARFTASPHSEWRRKTRYRTLFPFRQTSPSSPNCVSMSSKAASCITTQEGRITRRVFAVEPVAWPAIVPSIPLGRAASTARNPEIVLWHTCAEIGQL